MVGDYWSEWMFKFLMQDKLDRLVAELEGKVRHLEEEVNTANRRIAENQVESAIWESLKIWLFMWYR